VVILIVIVIVPSAIYLSRDRNPPNYENTPSDVVATYAVGYDSGDGLINSGTFTLKIVGTEEEKDSVTCFHVVTVSDPSPKRKVNAIIVGSAKVTIAAEEVWRSQSDFRIVHRKVMETDLPMVNTAITEMPYAEYENYPGWPYHLNDTWTYKTFHSTDVPLQKDWTDTFRADVVSDNAIIEIGGLEYHCFKVIHTLTTSTTDTLPGGAVGSTIIEYWDKSNRSIGPLKVENSVSYRGTETRIMISAPPSLPF
jgi:hypothetical protein